MNSSLDKASTNDNLPPAALATLGQAWVSLSHIHRVLDITLRAKKPFLGSAKAWLRSALIYAKGICHHGFHSYFIFRARICLDLSSVYHSFS